MHDKQKIVLLVKSPTSKEQTTVSVAVPEGKGTFASDEGKTYGTFYSQGNRLDVAFDGIEKDADITLVNPAGRIQIGGDIEDAGNFTASSGASIKMKSIKAAGDVSLTCISADVDPETAQAVMRLFK